MPVNSSVVCSQATDGSPPPQVLGGPHNGIQGGALLRRPVHWLQGGHTGRLTITHHIKYGGGHSHPSLGYDIGRVGCGSRGDQ